MSVARSSSGMFTMLTTGRIVYRQEGGDGSAQSGRSVVYDYLVMVALCNRADHYIFILFLSFFFFFSSANLSGRRLDVYHTSTYGVALVRI